MRTCFARIFTGRPEPDFPVVFLFNERMKRLLTVIAAGVLAALLVPVVSLATRTSGPSAQAATTTKTTTTKTSTTKSSSSTSKSKTGTSTTSTVTLAQLGVVPASATPTVTSAKPSCPGALCLAVSRTTGYQAKVGTVDAPFVVPVSGRIVAWTITLGAPNAKQISFFDTNEGGAAEAGIAVLRGGTSLKYSLAASGPLELLQPYFGGTVQFPLTTTIAVHKGDVVALTVPTWAPALALGYNSDTSWRASRSKTECTKTNVQTAHVTVGTIVQYYCLYKTARLTYSATLVTNPVLIKNVTSASSTSATSTVTTTSTTTATTTLTTTRTKTVTKA